jgi:nicotinamide mononucleotide adenylyltransferase
MKNILAKAVGQSSSSSVKYAMFIGRWSVWHEGHRWLIDQALNEGKKVLLCVRDVEPDEKNPWTAHEVLVNVAKALYHTEDEVQIARELIDVSNQTQHHMKNEWDAHLRDVRGGSRRWPMWVVLMICELLVHGTAPTAIPMNIET